MHHIEKSRPADADRVDTVMLVEPFIFGCDDGFGQHRRNLRRRQERGIGLPQIPLHSELDVSARRRDVPKRSQTDRGEQQRQVSTSVHPESVVLIVENTGEKLSPELVSTLAEPFVRGTERIRTDDVGVGLGLAIVKSITQAHDGALTLRPRTAGGLCVTVQLPLRPHTGS